MDKKIALFTVCDNKFVPGLENLLFSFVTHNPEYAGDIVVGYSKKLSPLSQKNQNNITNKFHNTTNLRFVEIDEEPYEKISRNIPPQARRFVPALLVFHAFSLVEYDQVVYADSDILIQKNLDEVFNLPGEWCVFRDTYQEEESLGYLESRKLLLVGGWKGKIKSRYVHVKRKCLVKTYNYPVIKFFAKGIFFLLGKVFRVSAIEHNPHVYFNSGFFSIGKKFLSLETHQELCRHALSCQYVFFPDQDILNSFALTYADGLYYLDGKRNGLKIKYEDKTFDQIKIDSPWIIHYVGKKPWTTEDEGDQFYHLFNWSLVGGRKIEVGYRVRESYEKINDLWKQSYLQYGESSF